MSQVDIKPSDKMTMLERLEIWREAKFQESKANKKSSPHSNQRRKTFALSMLPSPVDGPICAKRPPGAFNGKRTRNTMSKRDNLLSPTTHQMSALSISSPSPCQDMRRQRLQDSNGWTNSPPSPIQLSSVHASPHFHKNSKQILCDRSPSNNDGYVTASEDLSDEEESFSHSYKGGGCNTTDGNIQSYLKDKENNQNQMYSTSTSERKSQSPSVSKSLVLSPKNSSSCTPNKFQSGTNNTPKLSNRGFKLDKQRVSGSSAGSSSKEKESASIIAQLNKTIIQLKKSLEVANEEVKVLIENDETVRLENQKLRIEIESFQESEREHQTRCDLAREDVEAMAFANSINEQRIVELEVMVSKSRMSQNEHNNKRSKKYKEEYDRLEKDKTEYEQRANAMITQLQTQMCSLQESAMSRIEMLEKDLMEAQHKNEELTTQINKANTHKRQSVSGGRRQSSARMSMATSSRRQSSFLPPPLLEGSDEDEEEEEEAEMDTEAEKEQENASPSLSNPASPFQCGYDDFDDMDGLIDPIY